MRKTIRQLTAIVAAAVGSPSFSFVAAAGDKGIRGFVEVAVGDATYQIATDAGKIRVFGDIDSAVKAIAKIKETNDGEYSVKVETGSLFASPAPVNVEAYYEGLIAKLGKAKTAQQAKSAELAALLASMVGWNTGNAAQVARFEEVTAQKACVDADILAIDAEVVRLTDLLPGA